MNLTNIFLKVVDMSLTASWVALAVLVLRFVLKKAPKWLSCLLWVLVAFRLVCPVSFESALSLVSVEGARDVTDNILDSYVGPSSTYWDITEEYDAAVNAGIEPIHGGEGHYYVVTGETPTTEAAILADDIAILWVAGIGAMVVYGAVSYFRLRRKVAASLMTEQGIYLCDYIDTPFILGIIRPRIYLPSNMEPDAAAHVIAHERAHLNRKDHWWKPLGYLLLTVHWFNPVMWLAYILLCRDIELACDEKVIRKMEVGEKKAYSEALLACSVSRHRIAACPLAFGEVGVGERVKSVRNYKKPTFWIILITVIALVIGAVCFLTDPVEPDPIRQCVDAMVELQNADSIYAKSYSLDDPAVVNYHFQSEKGSIFQYVMPQNGGTTSVEMLEYEGKQFMRQRYFYEDSAMDVDSLWQSEFWMTFESFSPGFMETDWAKMAFEHVDTQNVNGEEVICLRCPQAGKLFWFYFADGKLAYYDSKDDVDEPEVQTYRTELIYKGRSVSEYLDTAYADAGEQASEKGYIRFIVQAHLLGYGSPYADISERDIDQLKALNWDIMDYIGGSRNWGGDEKIYVFSVNEPVVMNGESLDSYQMIFKTNWNGDLISVTRSRLPVAGNPAVVDFTGYVKSVVEDYLQNGSPYLTLLESDIRILKAIDWEKLEYTGSASDSKSTGYIFTVWEPMVINGKVEEYYYLNFEIDTYGNLIGFSKSAPERMADTLSLYELCQLDAEDVTRLDYSALYFDNACNDRETIDETIGSLKKIDVYASPVEDITLDEMISEVSIHLLFNKGRNFWHFNFDPVNGYVGLSKGVTKGQYGFTELGVYKLVDPEDVEKLYSAIGYDRDRYFAFSYHVGEDGTLSPVAEASEAELYLTSFFGTYYDGTEIPGYVSVDGSEPAYLMQLMREIPESAWEDGAHEEDWGEFHSRVYLALGENTEAYLFCTDGGVNLKFYRDGTMLEKTYHIRYAPLNEFMESICNKSRREGNIRIWYPEDDLVEYTHEDVTIALQPMVGWEFEIVPYTDESTPFGIRCRPEWEEEGWLFVSYRPGGFATCGTGLETREWQWSNFQDDVIYDVTYGYFDGSENWSYIWFTNLHGDYVILNEGADAWFQRADDISHMVMGSDGEGLLQPVEENDLQQTHEQITAHSSKDSSDIVDMIDKLRDAADGTPAQ